MVGFLLLLGVKLLIGDVERGGLSGFNLFIGFVKISGKRFLGICILKIYGVIIWVYKVVKLCKIFLMRILFFGIFFIELGLLVVCKIKL